MLATCCHDDENGLHVHDSPGHHCLPHFLSRNLGISLKYENESCMKRVTQPHQLTKYPNVNKAPIHAHIHFSKNFVNSNVFLTKNVINTYRI